MCAVSIYPIVIFIFKPADYRNFQINIYIERSDSLACYAVKIVTDFDLGLLEPRDEDSIVLRNVDRAQPPETLHLQQHCCEKHRLHKRDLLLRCAS